MSRVMTVQECDHAVSELRPDLPRPEQKALAALVSGVVLERDARLSRASTGIPSPVQDRSKQRRAQRLLANPRLDVGRAQRPLLRRVLAGRRGRRDLLLDATTTGATAHQAGTVSLVLALGWHGRALPLVWRTWTADEPGQDWTSAIRQMCTTAQAALPPQVQVVLLADRGLTGAPLAHLTQELGLVLCHGHLKQRVRPMRGFKRLTSADTMARRHGLIQKLRNASTTLSAAVPHHLRLAVAWPQLAQMI